MSKTYVLEKNDNKREIGGKRVGTHLDKGGNEQGDDSSGDHFGGLSYRE